LSGLRTAWAEGVVSARALKKVVPMDQPWRDVMPVAAWNATTSSCTDQALSLVIRQVGSSLSQYHRLVKDRLEIFPSRESLLRIIHSGTGQLMGASRQRRSEASRPLWKAIVSLHKQSKLKAGYLKTIREFYAGRGRGVYDPADLVNFLKSPPSSVGPFAHLQSGCRMEAVDPFHRPFELHLSDSHQFRGQDFNSPMMWAFGEWLGIIVHNDELEAPYPKVGMTGAEINTKGLKPFFVWLETHPICVNPDKMAFGTAPLEFDPDSLSSVQYSPYGQSNNYGRGASGKGQIPPVEGIHWLLPTSQGSVMVFPLENPKKGLELYDTTGLPGKAAMEGAAAFVWTQCGTLLAGKHEPQKFHHSTFVAGDSVRCAGMIRVVGGKVDLIANDSGHYRPSRDKLREFAVWLTDRNVFARDAIAVVQSASGSERMPIRDLITPLGDVHVRRIKEGLDELRKLMDGVAEQYGKSEGRFVSFIRSRSLESKNAVAYLSGPFRNDIETAKSGTAHEYWWKIPAKVVMALLGEPGAESLQSIAQSANEGGRVLGLQPFSKDIAQLKPLKKTSTLYPILEREWKKWRVPSSTGRSSRAR
jgi:hypothetical protein